MKKLLNIWLAAVLIPVFLPFHLSLANASGQGAVLNEAGVRRIITDYLRNKTSLPGIEISLKKLGFSGKIELPPGKQTYEVMAPQEWEGWGKGSLALIVRVDDKVAGNIPINVEVEAMTDVVVAVRGMERGMVVEKGDVALQKRDLATLPRKTCRDLQDVIGKMVKIGMRGNSPVRSDYIVKVPLVKNGQMVQIIAENDNFRITTNGISKSNGAEGDQVIVRRENGLKEIHAVVVNSDTVRVEF